MAELLNGDELKPLESVNNKFRSFEPKQRDRFICEFRSVETDEGGDYMYGLPSYCAWKLSNIVSTKDEHKIDIHYYLPVVPYVEDDALDFLRTGREFTVTIKDLGPVGDKVCEKVYSECEITSIRKSYCAYDAGYDGEGIENSKELDNRMHDSASTIVVSVSAKKLHYVSWDK